MNALYLFDAGEKSVPVAEGRNRMDLHYILSELKTFGLRKTLFLLLLVLIPVALYLFQSAVFGGNFTGDFILRNFVLQYSDPTVLSMFFANYTHNPTVPDHLFVNIVSFLVFGFLVWFSYYHIIPVPGSFMPENFLAINLALIFFVFPFAISGVAIFFYRLGSLPAYVMFGVGFSGIVWAFTGLLLFLLFFILMIELFAANDLSGPGGLQELRMKIAVVLFSVSVGVMSLFFLILADVGTESNPFAHFAGFAVGFVIPGLVALFLDSEKPLQRSSYIVVISALLVLASVAWLFL